MVGFEFLARSRAMYTHSLDTISLSLSCSLLVPHSPLKMHSKDWPYLSYLAT